MFCDVYWCCSARGVIASAFGVLSASRMFSNNGSALLKPVWLSVTYLSVNSMIDMLNMRFPRRFSFDVPYFPQPKNIEPAAMSVPRTF